MNKIQSVGTPSIQPPVPEETSAVANQTPPAPESAPATLPQQDAQDKLSGLQMQGQMRAAQVRSQLDSQPQFKMPGVEVKGPAPDDPKIANGFKDFDKPMPSVEMKWPDKGDFKETTDKDGTIHRQMTDADGTDWQETVDKAGSKSREMTDKNGNRRMEITDASGFVLRGGSDNKGNSWTINSEGVTTRMHSDPAGRMFNEVRLPDGTRSREMRDTSGHYFTEKLQQDGKLERETGDAAGNHQLEARDPKTGYWLKGFADGKGNSYTVDSEGASNRMHSDRDGRNYSESTYKDGSRVRLIADPKGESWIERMDPNGTITRSREQQKAS